MSFRVCIGLAAAFVALSACDNVGTDGSPVPLTPQSAAAMSPGDLRASLTEFGQISTADLDLRFAGYSDYNPLFSSGLWVAGTQGGETRVNAIYYENGTSNYGPCGDGTGGVFSLSADVTYRSEGWPAAAGAPVTADGRPRVYGDEMLWTSLCSVPADANSLQDRPLSGLRTNVAVYRYDDDALTYYVRYELRNEGTEPISDAYLGQWSDPDWYEAQDNLSGWDTDRALSYVYLTERINPAYTARGGELRTSQERGRVTGVAVLQTPSDAPLAGHRRLDKNVPGPTNGYLSTSSGYTYEAYRNALKGLGNDGSTLTDPMGTPSRFAFTGDPVAQTGWLDGVSRDGSVEGRELRDLVSAGPFDLAPGESAAFSVVWAVAVGTDLAGGLGMLRQTVDEARATTARWRF